MTLRSLGFRSVKVVALAVRDRLRAHGFYGELLALAPAYEGGERVGYFVGDTILMLKDDWPLAPTDQPNPRITLEVDDPRRTDEALRGRGVVIADPLAAYGDYLVGSFLDCEGNKLWFCGRAEAR